MVELDWLTELEIDSRDVGVTDTTGEVDAVGPTEPEMDTTGEVDPVGPSEPETDTTDDLDPVGPTEPEPETL